ncbi:hypothetical protein [Oceanobacillus jeddahense]|uniref:hypothetical protein n=1 Tax=Oceanobacillus jeddahense TaxID=1462527 RepID=UPI000595D487|nr:hypothetical protein [Oceanobacillus jeddahense]
MMGKISLYGTVIPIVLVLLVGFIIIGGWKFLLLIAGIAAVGKLLSKFLSEAWVDPILFLLFIAGIQYLIQDIYVTMIVAFSMILVRLIGKFMNNKKIESVFVFLITFAAALILEYSEDIFHKEVEVSESEVYHAEQDFESAYDAVENAVIHIEEEEKTIYLHFSVEGFDAAGEVEELGETFAETISNKVRDTQEIEGSNTGNYGELFQDYDLRIYIKDEESDDLLTGTKVTEATEISWYIYNTD